MSTCLLVSMIALWIAVLAWGAWRSRGNNIGEGMRQYD